MCVLALGCAACQKAEHGATGAIALLDADAIGKLPAALAVLKSDRLAARALDHLQLTTDAAWGGSEAAAIQKLHSMMRVGQRGALAQLEVTVVEPDQKRAVLLCNVLLAVYLESRLKQQMLTVHRQPADDQPLLNDARVIEVCRYK